MRIADTHAHLYFKNFNHDREEVIQGDYDAGVRLSVQIGCDQQTSLQSLELAEKYSYMCTAIGIHPCSVKEVDSVGDFFVWAEMVYKKNREKIKAVGETGIDLYHESSAKIQAQQEASFGQHLDFAVRHNLALIIHLRNARKEALEFFQKHKEKFQKIPVVVHCFCEDKIFAKILTEEFGFYIGIGGIATYPKSEEVREAITQTPIEKMLTETDAPFLPSHGYKKSIRRSESKHIEEIIRLIAQLKNIDTEACAEILFQNSLKFFNISEKDLS